MDRNKQKKQRLKKFIHNIFSRKDYKISLKKNHIKIFSYYYEKTIIVNLDYKKDFSRHIIMEITRALLDLEIREG